MLTRIFDRFAPNDKKRKKEKRCWNDKYLLLLDADFVGTPSVSF